LLEQKEIFSSDQNKEEATSKVKNTEASYEEIQAQTFFQPSYSEEDTPQKKRNINEVDNPEENAHKKNKVSTHTYK
jgi:hypothetical protein